MSDEVLRERFEAFLAALREHFEAALKYQDPDDEHVLDASDQVEDAFQDYDKELFDHYDIEIPLDIFEFEDFEGEEAEAQVARFVDSLSDSEGTIAKFHENADDFDEGDEDEDDEEDDFEDLAAHLYDSDDDDYEYSDDDEYDFDEEDEDEEE